MPWGGAEIRPRKGKGKGKRKGKSKARSKESRSLTMADKSDIYLDYTTHAIYNRIHEFMSSVYELSSIDERWMRLFNNDANSTISHMNVSQMKDKADWQEVLEGFPGAMTYEDIPY